MLRTCMATAATALQQTGRGIRAALRSRWRVVLWVSAAVALFNLNVPVLVLSVVREPPDFVTFNPWLCQLPEHLASFQPLAKNLSFVSQIALRWVNADHCGS